MFASKRKKYQHLLCIVLFFLLFPPIADASDKPSPAAAVSLSGKDVATQVYYRENGESASGAIQMILIDAAGSERLREFQFFRKDAGPLSKNLTRFTEPPDIRGTAFLSIEKSEGETEQFLFLPSLRRTRRIIASQRDTVS